MIEINGNNVIGKCAFCKSLITEGAKHYVINKGLHLYYICPKCNSDMVLVMEGEKWERTEKN